MRGQMAHTLMYCTWSLLHVHLLTQKQMHPCKDSTQWAVRSGLTVTEKKIFEEDMLPVAMEHSERKTYTQRRTPTHDALSILKKMDQSHTREDKHTYTCMYIRTRSINHCPITESNEAAASFKSITASVIALGLCVCVCVCQRLCLFLHMFYLYLERKKGPFFKNNIALPFVPLGQGELCQLVNQILHQRGSDRGTARGRMK